MKDINTIKKSLENNLIEAKTKRELWNKVEFITKKDGTPFKVLSKNIVNATIKQDQFAMQTHENQIYVSGRTENYRYINDYINCYDILRYIKDEKKLAKTENIAPKQSYLEQIYVYDIEDIKDAVQKRIDYYTDYIISLENQLESLENAYNTFKQDYEKMLDNLYENSNGKSDLYFNILDTIR